MNHIPIWEEIAKQLLSQEGVKLLIDSIVRRTKKQEKERIKRELEPFTGWGCPRRKPPSSRSS